MDFEGGNNHGSIRPVTQCSRVGTQYLVKIFVLLDVTVLVNRFEVRFEGGYNRDTS